MSYMKIPEVAELQEFEMIDTYNKKHHPVQFFFRNVITDWFDYKKFYIQNKIWEFKHRWIPKHNYSKVYSGLPDNQYHDIPELMLYVNFKFLERYIVEEDCFNKIVWEDGCEREFVASELTDLWYWWKEIRPKREGVEEFLYSYISNDNLFKKPTDKDYEIYDELYRLEVFWQEEDTYNLKRLVALRPWMWS